MTVVLRERLLVLRSAQASGCAWMAPRGPKPPRYVLLRTTLVVIWFCSLASAYAQPLSVLHIKVLLLDANRHTTPVAHHALLISDDPPSTPPRRVLTGADGTVDVSLRPGRYAIESDRPVAFQGRAYEWSQRITVAAGKDSSLELNAENATAATSTPGSSLENDPAFLLNQWNRSVVGIWTALAHGAGFIVDSRSGLIATNARVAGSASDVEVQFTSELKVRARIITANADRDVAILQVHPSLTESIPALSPDCAAASTAQIARGQDLVTISAPPGEPSDVITGTTVRADAKAVTSDLRLPIASAGSPVFTGSRLVGVTSTIATADDDRQRWASRVVGVDAICAVLASAEEKVSSGTPPTAAHLPVDPPARTSTEKLKTIVARSAGSLSPPQISATDFDVALITPVHTFGAQSSPFTSTRQRVGPGLVDGGSPALRPVRDFANWSEYVAAYPPVLLIRATPKLAEGFWTAVARGAAQTQGVPLPAMKHAKAGFASMRAFCGGAEVTPIHPFKLEQRVSASDVIYEGLYVFDADALGPQCGTVTLTLYSDRQGDKGDTRQVDPTIIQRLAQDFAASR